MDPSGAVLIMPTISVVETALDPLTTLGFADVLNDAGEDYYQVGNGYIEVRRDYAEGGDSNSATLIGLSHVPAADVFLCTTTDGFEFFEIQGEGYETYIFSRFGQRDRLLEHPDIKHQIDDPNKVSELIEFRQASSASARYGYPDWLAAIPVIDLVQCLTQFSYDFFNNRGVPEFLLIVEGAKLGEEAQAQIETAMKANIGLGNSHKSTIINVPTQGASVRVEKLALDTQDQNLFSAMSDSLAIKVVTAHRVPPLLAGITIPGKLGASNELESAMKAFQSLVIRQAQRTFSNILGNTLGNPTCNGGLGISRENFLFRTIIDDFEMANLEASIRAPVANDGGTVEGG